MRTRVAIVGGGPSGLLLSLLLTSRGIANVVLERRSKAVVLARVRAGVLEQATVSLLDIAGAAQRLHTERHEHRGTVIYDGTSSFRIDLIGNSGRPVFVYGQTEVTRDLYACHAAAGGEIVFNVDDLAIHDANSEAPFVSYTAEGRQMQRLDAEFIAGCDGFHGASRQAIPAGVRRDYEKILPFGWLGVLSATPPVHQELIYASTDRGFALCSMRSAALSRYYIQCAATDAAADWSDDAFWDELRLRLPPDISARLVTGPSIEKSVIPLRSFVTEPMQWGRLFLCGDAAHIFPPTGAKGLNAAVADVGELFAGLSAFYATGDRAGLDGYSAKALDRVWKTLRFSMWLTNLLHRFPDQSPFEARIQAAELAFLRSDAAAQKAMADHYVGLAR